MTIPSPSVLNIAILDSLLAHRIWKRIAKERAKQLHGMKEIGERYSDIFTLEENRGKLNPSLSQDFRNKKKMSCVQGVQHILFHV
jgi:hypothetical protein